MHKLPFQSFQVVKEKSLAVLDALFSLLVLFRVENDEFLSVLVATSGENRAFLHQIGVQSLRGYIWNRRWENITHQRKKRGKSLKIR